MKTATKAFLDISVLMVFFFLQSPHRLIQWIQNGYKIRLIGAIQRRIFYSCMAMQLGIIQSQHFLCVMHSFKMDNTIFLWWTMGRYIYPVWWKIPFYFFYYFPLIFQVSRAPCYISLVQNIQYVSNCVASYLKDFFDSGMQRKSITCIGHSMGAHGCGLLKRYLGFRINKIIG